MHDRVWYLKLLGSPALVCAYIVLRGTHALTHSLIHSHFSGTLRAINAIAFHMTPRYLVMHLNVKTSKIATSEPL